MSLVNGQRLGPYEVIAPLGAGGMGEVYRARDTRLGRAVAIKLLPSELSTDAGRLKRFEREARAASALSHPNIVTIYEIGEIDSVRFIAMECVDGKTLRELLLAGPIPTKRLLGIATQAAGGLAKAHEAGIVHRDLKPENIMVTTDGLVKILDFGLAKLTQTVTGEGEVSQLPTQSRAGTVLGTVCYMSPEQASGQAVDIRSDQFSFGSILYEMATGTRPFQGETAVDTLSAILHDDPAPVSASNPSIPPPLRWIIERCLSKAPDERYDSTGDLAREFAALRLHLTEATAPTTVGTLARSPHRRRVLFGGAAVAALCAGVGLGLVLAGWVNAPEYPRFRRLTYRHGSVGTALFAPGGQDIVYSASWEGRPFRVFTMNLGSADSRDLGIEGHVFSISPKGELLGGTSADPYGGATYDLWLASLSSEATPRALAEKVWVATLSLDGEEIALIRPVDAPSVKSRLEFPMGKVLYESRRSLFGRPGVSPDARRVTVAERSDTSVDVVTVDRSGRHSTIASFPRASGVFGFSGIRGRNWLMRDDGSAGTEVLEVTPSGSLRSRLHAPLELTLEDVASDGRWLVDSYRFRVEMLLLEAGAASPRTLSWSAHSTVADLSADGQTVLFTEGGGASSVYTRKVDGSPAVRLGAGAALALSPDGRWVLAAPDPEKHELALYPTGAGETRTISLPGVELAGGRFFPGGDRLLLYGSEADKTRCYVLPMAGGPPQPLGAGEALLPLGEGEPAFIAPDGRTVLLRTRDGWRRVASEGSDVGPLLVKGLGREEQVMRFRQDGRAVFTRREQERGIVIDAFDLETGRRTLVRRLPLGEDAFASVRLHPACITPDGKTVVYSEFSSTSDLYLVDRLR